MQTRKGKIHDAEVLAWACANLKEGFGMPMSVIESLAWEQFKDRGVKRHGFGGKIRRLFPANCSAFPHRFKKGSSDLFVVEGRIPGNRHRPCRVLWSLKPGAAHAFAEQVQVQAA